MTDETMPDSPLPRNPLPRDPAATYNQHRSEMFDDVLRSSAEIQIPPELLAPPEQRKPPAEVLFPTGGPEERGTALRRMITQGGFGEIWESEQLALSRVVAVKRLREDLETRARTDDSAWLRMKRTFLQEALTTANLEHPNIIPIYDYGEDGDGRPLLAMKLVRGKPWTDMISVDQAMPMEDFLARHLPVLIDVSQAVAFAHSRGIIHRDIKPGQVMVGEFGEVILADWGLALVFDPERTEAEHLRKAFREAQVTLEHATSPSGTVAFMAPEQTHKNTLELGPWTDIFLLGGTLYYLLTLSYPHNAPEVKAAFAQARHGFIEPPEERAPQREIPAELSRLALWAMKYKPADRPATVGAFIAELHDYLSGANVRRESQSLTREVELRAWKGNRSYEELSDMENTLAQALNFWPGNRHARQLRQGILREYAQAALENGDLKLAMVEARRLEECADREELLRRIQGREVIVRRNLRQRRVFFYSALVLLVMAAVLALVSDLRRFEAETSRKDAVASLQMAETALLSAHNSRLRAEAARSKAEELVSFMIRDLQGALGSGNSSDLLTLLAEEATGVDLSKPRTSEEMAELDRIARSLYEVSLLLAENGDARTALRAITTSLAITEALVAEAGSGAGLLVEKVRRLSFQSELLRRVARLPESRAAGEEAKELMVSMMEAWPEPPPSMNQVCGRLQLTLGRVALEDGREEASREYLDHAAECLAEIAPGDRTRADRRSLAMAYLLLKRPKDAKPIIDGLMGSGERESEFMLLVRQNGLLSPDLR